MQKLIVSLLFISLLLAHPVTAQAQSTAPSYEAAYINSEAPSLQNLLFKVLRRNVYSVEITYKQNFFGDVTPPASLSVTKEYDGKTYSGTVTRSSYTYDRASNITVGIYHGTLYSVN